MKSHVDANYRYIAAYNEVNARIAQRQQALAIYVTLTVGLLASLVALKPGGQDLPVEWLLLGFPGASACLALLNCKSERAITNLRRFLGQLERLDNAHQHLPSYNTEPEWAASANRARRFHDIASAILVAGGNLIAFGAAFAIYPERLARHPLAPVLAIAGALAAVAALYLNSRWSYRPRS